MEIEDFTEEEIERLARQIIDAAEPNPIFGGTDEDEFERIGRLINDYEGDKSALVNAISKEVEKHEDYDGLRDLITSEFSGDEEDLMAQMFGYPKENLFSNNPDEVYAGPENMDISNFEKFGRDNLRDAASPHKDIPIAPDNSEYEDLLYGPEAKLFDVTDVVNEPPKSFKNIITTSAEPAFTEPQTKIKKLPTGEGRDQALEDEALKLSIGGPVAALEKKIRDARLDEDFPMQEVPSLPPKNANIRGEELQRLKNQIRDINASNFESQKALKKRNSILGGSDFDHFVKSLADMGVDTDPRDMDKNTLFRLYDRYRYNRPSMVIPSSNRQIGQRIQDRNSTIQNEDDMFTAYAGPSTGGQLKMVRKAEADRLSDLDNARTQESQVPEMTEEEGAAFWDSGFRNRNNWY